MVSVVLPALLAVVGDGQECDRQDEKDEEEMSEEFPGELNEEVEGCVVGVENVAEKQVSLKAVWGLEYS